MKFIFYTAVTISLLVILAACGKRQERQQDMPETAPDNTRTTPDTTMPENMPASGSPGY
jgi:hypothetical protein